MRVTRVAFTPASFPYDALGVIGWLCIALDDSVEIDGIRVRRTVRGRIALAFPARRDGAGRRRYFVRPLNDETRREIERQVIERLLGEQRIAS